MRKKILSVLLIILLIVFAMQTSVSALSFTATMTPSSTTVAEATEFTVKVKVSNLDVGSNGINSLTGYLKYDTAVFDTIIESSIESLNDWSVTYDATTGKISLSKSTFVTSAQEVFQIAFKTKSDVSGQSGTISYTNIVASNSETDIKASDISTSITVGSGDSASDTSNTSTNVSVITTNTTSTNTASNTSNNSVTINTTTAPSITNATTNNSSVSSYVNTTTNTTTGDDMPYTGVDDTLFKLVFVAIAAALGFYIKLEKLNKDMK